jgi:hypothetical protein
MIQDIPIPESDPETAIKLSNLAVEGWRVGRSLDAIRETSPVFGLPALLDPPSISVIRGAEAVGLRIWEAYAALDRIQAEIDDRCFALYGIDDADRAAITAGFGAATGDDEGGGADADDGDDEVAEAPGADPATLAADLVSWAVGVAFGRFDVRLATGERPAPAEPGPLDPLPPCSPAMLVGDDGLPAAAPPPGYPVHFPEDGILVDDPGHPRDLVAAVGRVFDVVFGAAADAWLQEVVRVLDPRASDLRPWLATRFFDHHLKRHSMSRRKAPILWPLASPKGQYRVWVAAHRATADTLHQIEATILKPRLDAATRLLEEARAEARANPGPAARDTVAKHKEMETEVRALRAEVLRVAPFWKPDLDDGVVLAAAPLWRLVPVHRAWQRELKSRWAALAKGDYDWAHLAMHLWPERALRRCAADRSVAIAHDVEAEFWQEVRPDTWVARPADPARDARLRAARFSENRDQAVKAFIDAPGG